MYQNILFMIIFLFYLFILIFILSLFYLGGGGGYISGPPITLSRKKYVV